MAKPFVSISGAHMMRYPTWNLFNAVMALQISSVRCLCRRCIDNLPGGNGDVTVDLGDLLRCSEGGVTRLYAISGSKIG